MMKRGTKEDLAAFTLIAGALAWFSQPYIPHKYEEGKSIPLEIQYNVDVQGNFSNSQIEDITNAYHKVHTKFPKMKNINTVIKEYTSDKYCAEVIKYDPSEHTVPYDVDYFIFVETWCIPSRNREYEASFENVMIHELGHVAFDALQHYSKLSLVDRLWRYREQLDEKCNKSTCDLNQYYVSDYARVGGINNNEKLIYNHLYTYEFMGGFDRSITWNSELKPYIQTVREDTNESYQRIYRPRYVLENNIKQITLNEEIAENFVMMFNDQDTLHPFVRDKVKELEQLLIKELRLR